jgi:putative tryptophan/tyrosine transport system substrate-binding protein
MRRREFLAGISAAALPVAARAQQPAMPVVGILHPTFVEAWDVQGPEFFVGLTEQGYVQERNVAVEYRWGRNEFDRLPALATDLVQRRVAVLVAPGGTAVARAAMTATKTIPVVFLVGSNPVQAGLVASLGRPGGNITGVTVLTNELVAKRTEMLHVAVPIATRIGLLTNASNPVVGEAETRLLREAVEVLGLDFSLHSAAVPNDLEEAFATLARQRIGALVVSADPWFVAERHQLVALAARYGIPAIYQERSSVISGGLMSYGAGYAESYRLVGTYVGRILKGDAPAYLPVQQVAKVELVINLKTAKALGLTIPTNLLAVADEVIE